MTAVVGMPEADFKGASPNAHLLIGEMPAPQQLKGSWWEGTGVSIVIHTIVLGALNPIDAPTGTGAAGGEVAHARLAAVTLAKVSRGISTPRHLAQKSIGC